MKPFKTHRQQIAILRERGLTIANGSTAMRIFERENYYNVINGYKDLFLLKDSKGNPQNPERFMPNTTLDEIYNLFSLDRELRNLFLKYILIFENSIKSKISYRFSEKFKEPHAYLLFKNYSSTDMNKVLGLIAIISNKIKDKSKDKKKNSINHYLSVYGNVPLWVLVNELTLGNISNFYQAIDDSLKDQIAKDFSLQFKKNYGASFQLPKESIVDVLKISNLVRNVCAHEERLYNFKLRRPTSTRHNAQLLSIPESILTGNIFTMLALLKLVLTKKEFKDLVSSLDKLFIAYKDRFSTIPFEEIIAIMGFENNWKTHFC